MQRLILYILTLSAVCSLYAEPIEKPTRRHELRIGMGDASLDKRFYEDPVSGYSPTEMQYLIIGMPAQEADAFLRSHYIVDRKDLRSSGNIFVEYQYHFNNWLSAGVDVNMLAFQRKYIIANGYHDFRGSYTTGTMMLSLIPRVRFTYFNRPHVQLYSGVGLGATIKTGLPLRDVLWSTTPLYPETSTSGACALDLTLFGISAGGEHLVGSFELSPMFHLGKNLDWFVAGGRLFKVAIGYKF